MVLTSAAFRLFVVVLFLTTISATPKQNDEVDYVQATPVEFVVNNPLEPGIPRTLRGDLFLPAGGADCDSVQLMLAGFSYGKWVWDLPGRPDYSYARAMAGAGYPVVTLDLLGYGASDRPTTGRHVSTTAYAEMVHQVVAQLRGGSYQGGPQRAFAQVVIGGHSAGAEVARLEAGTYGDVDGLVVTAMGNNVTPEARDAFVSVNVPMAVASDYVDPFFGDDGRWLDFGYRYPMPPQDEYAAPTVDDPESRAADPDIMALDRALSDRVPSGQLLSMVPAPSAAVIDRIRVPVLLAFAEWDEIVPVTEAATEPSRYSGSADVTAVIVAGAGHTFTLHHSREKAVTAVRRWLGKRPKVASRCDTTQVSAG